LSLLTYVVQVPLIYPHLDISMAIDAPGSLGFGYGPHFASSEKSSEPAKHKLVKVKATAAKLHGVGTWLAQSYPTLETQGELIYTEYM
jgi:hypothetical protein